MGYFIFTHPYPNLSTMKIFTVKHLLPVLCIGLLLSCEPENLPEVTIENNLSDSYVTNKRNNRVDTKPQQAPNTENLRNLILNAVAPSECGATEFSQVIWKHFTELAADELAVEYMNQYLYFQDNAVRLRIGTDYFGRNGEYTKHVEKSIRKLEMFWEMPNQIKVLGQHVETLNNRENLADIIWYTKQDLESREEVYLMVDEILARNELSPVLPNSPFFAADGYASHNNEIVLGDGLIQMFSETGLEEETVWVGILSHEWAHQVQFDHIASWYPPGYFDSRAEETRTIELEADFFSGYFMTHKRGATYNWKKAEEFFELFYQSGDCSFEFEQHHGTPLQRKRATYEGYLLAGSAKKQGFILSAEELHEVFISQILPAVVNDLQYL